MKTQPILSLPPYLISDYGQVFLRENGELRLVPVYRHRTGALYIYHGGLRHNLKQLFNSAWWFRPESAAIDEKRLSVRQGRAKLRKHKKKPRVKVHTYLDHATRQRLIAERIQERYRNADDLSDTRQTLAVSPS